MLPKSTRLCVPILIVRRRLGSYKFVASGADAEAVGPSDIHARRFHAALLYGNDEQYHGSIRSEYAVSTTGLPLITAWWSTK